MNAIRTRHLLGLFTVLTTLLVCFPTLTNRARGAVYGQGAGSDIDPANLPKGFSWATNGVRSIFYYKMDPDNKTIGEIEIKRYYAFKDFLATSPKVEDGDGKKYPRMYFERDFTEDEKLAVSRYWDKRMGVTDKQPGVTKLTDDPSVNQNCFNYAIVESKCKGKWERLILSPIGKLEADEKYAIPAAIPVLTDPIDKKDAQTNDLVIYTEPFGGAAAFVSHASLLHIDGMNKYLKYRYQSSPSYKYKLPTADLDTPMYYVAGNPTDINTWVWDPRAAGDGNKLWIGPGAEANNVYRPKK